MFKIGNHFGFRWYLVPLGQNTGISFYSSRNQKGFGKVGSIGGQILCGIYTFFYVKTISRIFTFLNFRLVNLPDVHVVVISGREVENLRAKVGVDGLTYAGNHGLHVMHADGQMYQHTIPQVNFKFPLFLSCA